MFNITKKTINWGGRELTLETGKVARQADGAVMVRYGGTTLLCTAVAQKEAKPDMDFFPLTCIYQEKQFAAGKIPGGFFKREGKPTEKETLTSRLIDRPIRPLFGEEFFNEVQVICTVLEYDGKNDGDIPALVGASAALAISGIPFEGPLAAAKVGLINGQYVLNPEVGFEDESRLDLVVAGTKTSVMMVESEAKEITEAEMLGAVKFAHDEMQAVISLITELAKEAGKARWEVVKADHSELENKIKKLVGEDFRKAYAITDKQARVTQIKDAKKKVQEQLGAEVKEGEELPKKKVDGILKKLEKDVVRGDILKLKKRIDGRGLEDIRRIEIEVGILPRTHGSALFTRGETQALVVTTLGTGQDEQRLDGLDGDQTSNFMLHYNFPPFSVGEVGRMTGAGRREIGHGKLAWRAIRPLLPPKESSPYTIRIVSEITESNGSSSMATVCGASLSLMDAGVELPRGIAGIAMGLILEGKEYAVLSDILGDEDHLGDMDFKVAGTETGVTSLQMDIKVQGITIEIMKQALEQANKGRLHILSKMNAALNKPRETVNNNAPKFKTITIPANKIREVIGKGGSVIKNICEVSGAKIDIEDTGEIKVAASTAEAADKAISMINDIVGSEPVVGEVYDAKVVKILDFGAVVQFLGKAQGLVHISEIANERIEKVESVLKLGDEVKAKVINVDRQGKIKLSIKQALGGVAPTANDNGGSLEEIETPSEITTIN
jgi:polyribonucleotide nucleotidyltransferase